LTTGQPAQAFGGGTAGNPGGQTAQPGQSRQSGGGD